MLDLPTQNVEMKLDGCSQCGIELPKYTCPKCAVKTCSMACCKQHKEMQKCDGARSTIPQFVPILGYSAYSERLSIEDQYFLNSVRMRAHSENTLKGMKRAYPLQQQPTAFKVLEKHLAYNDAKRPALNTTTESSSTIMDSVSTEESSQLSVSDALSPNKVSDSYKHQALLTSSLQRRIWLNLDGRGCGETKFDKVSETLFWTVDVKFLYSTATSAIHSPIVDVLVSSDSLMAKTVASTPTSLPDFLSSSVSQDVSAMDAPLSDSLVIDSSIADLQEIRVPSPNATDVSVTTPLDSLRTSVPLVDVSSTSDALIIDSSVANIEETTAPTSNLTNALVTDSAENIFASMNTSASLSDSSSTSAPQKVKDAADVPATVASTPVADLLISDSRSGAFESTESIELNPPLQSSEKTYTVHNIPETLSVSTLIRQFVRPKPFGALITTSEIDMEKMKPFIEAAYHDNGIMIYMKVPYGDKERYYVVDPSRSLLENLRNRFVDGYPTLIVTVSNQYDNFSVLTDTEAREMYERLRPSMGYRFTEPNHNRRLAHNNSHSSNGGNWNRNRGGRFQHNYSNKNNSNYRRGGNRSDGRNFYNNQHSVRNFNNTGNSHYRHDNYNHHNNRQGFRERPTDFMERFLDDPRFNTNPRNSS